MTKKKKRYTTEQKVIILKRHLVDRIAVSDLCDEYRHFLEKSFACLSLLPIMTILIKNLQNLS